MRILRYRILFIAAPMALFMVAGCVGMKSKPAHRSWPKPVATTEMRQFDGVFENRSLDAKTGEVSDRSNKLFDFLTNRNHSQLKRGTQVEIRSSPDESVLHVRLLDQEQLEIDSAELQRGVDFDLSKGFMNLHGPFLGMHSGAGNIAVGAEHQSSHLYVSLTGELLGKQTDRAAGLLFYFVPFGTSYKEWMMWPKLAQ